MDPPLDWLYLIGNGAVEGSWAPILQAIRNIDPEAVLDGEDVANYWLTQHVYELRQVAHFAQLTREERSWRLRRPQNAEEHRSFQAEQQQALDSFRGRDLALKRAIAIQLDAALERGELHVREALVRRFLGVQGSLELVTTNWDRALEARFPEFEDKIIHLHGDTRKPEALYLPSEMAREPYRTAAERHEFAKHTGLWKDLAQARNVVIYGLSMSALDAELA